LLTALENVSRWLKHVPIIVTAVGVITAIIGVGIIQLLYLSIFSIAISPVDTLSIRNLAMFMFALSALLISFVAIFIWPFFTPYFVLRETRGILPNLYGKPERGKFFNFLKEYVPYYLVSFVLSLIVMPVTCYFETPMPKIICYSMIPSFSISGLVLYIFRLKGLQLKFWAHFGIFNELLWTNIITIVAILLLQIIIWRVWQHGVAEIIGSKEKVTLEIIAMGLVGVFCHAFMAWRRPRLSTHAVAGLAVIALVVLWVYPGLATPVAVALREAQLGGGTPVSYVISGRATTPEPASGCLVLATTNQYVIGELEDNSCPLPRRFAFTTSGVKRRPAQVFSRSEVKITQVPGG
jgi:hypothetical protein